MKNRIIYFFVFCFINSSFIFADANISLKEKFKAKVKKVELKNGLKLIMLQRKNAPVFSVYTKFKVGACDESVKMAGTAHLLEHMLFKGSKQLGTKNYKAEKKYLAILEAWNERLEKYKLELMDMLRSGKKASQINEHRKKIKQLSRKIKNIEKLHRKYVIKEHDALIYSANGQVGFNAYTSQDVTNYQISLPANKLELWAMIESDRLKNPILREYYTERDVVIEERRMRTESIGFSKLRELYLATAFQIHPYRKPIIGYMSNIGFLQKRNTIDFFEKHYVPNNMVIAITGDIDFKVTEFIINKYFGDIPARPLPIPEVLDEVAQQGARRVYLKFPSGRKIIMGWHKPTLPHRDNVAFELLSAILTDGRNSLLEKSLKYDNQYALSVSSWNGDPGERYNNLFSIFITPMQNVSDATIEKEVIAQIQEITQGKIEDKTIQKYKNKLLTDFYRKLDSNSGLSEYLSYYETVYGDWSFAFDFFDEISKVNASDLKRIVKKYLVNDNLTTAVLINTKNEKKK